MTFQEVENEVYRDVGPVPPFQVLDQLAVPVKRRIGIPGTLVLGVPGVKEAMLVETCLRHLHALSTATFGVWEIRWIIRLQLPLAGNAGSVACILHQVAEGSFFWVKDTEVRPVAMVVFASHDLHAGRRAERLGVGVGETNATFGQLVDVWGPVGGSSITAETLNANVISQDEQNIRLGNPCLGKGGAENE